MPSRFFAKQLVDEIGFHSVRLQKLILTIFLVQLAFSILFGSWFSSLLYSLVLFVGFYGALKRKTCLLKIYACIHIFLFVLGLFAVIAGLVVYANFQNNVCNQIGAPSNETSQVFAVWDHLESEDSPFTPLYSTMLPVEHKQTPTPKSDVDVMPVEHKQTSTPKVMEILPIEQEEASTPNSAVDVMPISKSNRHHKGHKNHHKNHKNDDDDDDDDEKEEKYSNQFCWELEREPHCETEWSKSSFLGECINGKFHYEGKHIPFGYVLIFIVIISFLVTLKISSIVLSLKLACKIRCSSRGCNYQPLQVQEENYSQQVMMPVAFQPQYYPPTQPVNTKATQVLSDEELARQLQRQYDME